MVTVDQLKFDEKGLIPAIVVDFESKKVLTLAYMNKESLEISMEKGLTCFWSRSRSGRILFKQTQGPALRSHQILCGSSADGYYTLHDPGFHNF